MTAARDPRTGRTPVGKPPESGIRSLPGSLVLRLRGLGCVAQPLLFCLRYALLLRMTVLLFRGLVAHGCLLLGKRTLMCRASPKFVFDSMRCFLKPHKLHFAPRGPLLVSYSSITGLQLSLVALITEDRALCRV
jgi:hypothetical protein